MCERKDEQWLDDQLRKAIHGDTPRFDAETWRQKHPEEYRRLVARSVGWGLPHRVPMGRRSTMVVQLAAAAVIAVSIGLFALSRNAETPRKSTAPPGPAGDSPVEMMTIRSLRLAYEQGGFDGLDRQLQNTLDEFGPRSLGVPSWRLF